MTGSICRSGLKRSTIAAIEEVFKVRMILYTKSGGQSMGDLEKADLSCEDETYRFFRLH